MSKPSVAGSLLLLAAVFVAAAGAPQPVYKTPQEVFEASVKAYQREDFKALCTMLTDAAREQLAGQVAFGSLFTRGRLQASLKNAPEDKRRDIQAKLKSLNDVFANHGMTEAVLKKLAEMQQVPPQGPDAAKQMFKKFAAPIKDQCGFMVAMAPALKKLNPNAPKGGLLPPGIHLKDVKIEGDRATGFVAFKVDGKEERQPAAFRKVKGSWKIDEEPSNPAGAQKLPSGK